uniref:Uncharacterized protein n=1 Tax=Rhizophora mucronata TaxID=61149 RepID=A0A2P2R0I7_RHIMU
MPVIAIIMSMFQYLSLALSSFPGFMRIVVNCIIW